MNFKYHNSVIARNLANISKHARYILGELLSLVGFLSPLTVDLIFVAIHDLLHEQI
jgi:hypothetical protein